jgi:hypothetical protein
MRFAAFPGADRPASWGLLLALLGLLPLGPLSCDQTARASGVSPPSDPEAGATASAELAPTDSTDAGDAVAPAAKAAPSTEPWPDATRLPVADRGGDRIYSKVRFLWIHAQPAPTKSWLGYLSLGDSVRVRGGVAASARVADAAGDADRCRAWYAVEPTGFVCTGEDATLDAEDPVVRALRTTAADPSSPWPYEYGESLGTPVYHAVPGRDEQLRAEPDLAQHRERVDRARRNRAAGPSAGLVPELDGVEVGPTGEGPPPMPALAPYARGIRTRFWPGTTIAFTRRFDAGGRSWLLTWDRSIVPSDRVRSFPRSGFAGVPLGEDRRLPLAFFRARPRPQYRRTPAGRMKASGGNWPRLGWVGLTGRQVEMDGKAYLETAGGELYCAAEDATVVDRTAEVPPRVASQQSGRRTWLDISVLGGWLVAYEGARPVYATLISPGRGGVPLRGVPPIDTASTPTGQFTVTGKFLTATMTSTSDANIVHAEVQYTQNFSGPHALHGAYWHDGWGERKSGGCVNLSPVDARRVFAWTDPPLPAGWHGVRWIPGQAASTAIVIHR